MDTRLTRWKMQGRRKGHWEGSVKKGASGTIGRKDEAANKNEPLQDLFSLFNFQSEIQPPAAVRHPLARRWERTIAGNPAQQGYHLAKFPAFIILLSYGHKKATFSNLLGRRSNITTDGRAIEPPRLVHRLGMFSDHHIFTGPEPTSN